jgi:pimeloyl-ACP methyl ester carboxylesterase
MHLVELADGTRLHVRKWGEGKARYLFIHGLGEGSFVWNHIAPDFKPALAVDLRGHGDSSQSATGCYKEADCVDDIVFLFDALALSDVILVGHSFGVRVGLQATARLGARVRSLVLVDGGSIPQGPGIEFLRRGFREQRWQFASIEDYLSELARRFPLAPKPVVEDIARQALRALPRGGFELKCDRRLATDLQRSADAEVQRASAAILCHVLLIRGQGSSVVSAAAAEHLAQSLARCELRTVPRAGHSVMLDNPSVFREVLSDFVTRTHS